MKIVYDKKTLKIIASYDTNFKGKIPTPNIEISDATWNNATNIGADTVALPGKTLIKKNIKSKTQIAIDNIAILTLAWKTGRQTKVDNIEVTYKGVIYQGDETSQNRMARAIIALPNDIITTNWTAKDNKEYPLNRLDLTDILTDAGNQQTYIWNIGRP